MTMICSVTVIILAHSNDIRLDIILLLGIHQTVLIRHKIGTHRIKQKNQIIQCQIPECYTLWLFHKIWQKGDNRKSLMPATTNPMIRYAFLYRSM